MSEVKIVSCEYKDGTETYFFENVFELTDKQKEELKTKISQITREEHSADPYKMTINTTQQKEILQFHHDLISALKDAYSAESDKELAEQLEKEELIIFSRHALERLVERFSRQSNSPFSKIFEVFDLDPQSPDDLAIEATEILLKANQVQPKVEWNTSNFCRINYYLDGDKTILSVENHYLPDIEPDDYFFVVTVMKNDLQ